MSANIITHDSMVQMEYILRDTHRIKIGVDWAYVMKYEQVHVLCAEIWYDTIAEVATEMDLPVKIVTFEYEA